jgi:hypothetical protein
VRSPDASSSRTVSFAVDFARLVLVAFVVTTVSMVRPTV